MKANFSCESCNHTSGLPNISGFSSAIQDSLRKLSISEQVHIHFIIRIVYLPTYILLNPTPCQAPGQYSSSAMMVLVLLLENVYHKPYEIVTQFLRTHLKMYNTRPYLASSQVDEAVQGITMVNRSNFLI